MEPRRINNLNFAVEKSLRYHQRRRAHYEWLHKAVMFGVILTGSAAFAQLYEGWTWFGAGAAALGALDLVFAFSHKARDHEILHRDFTALAMQVRSKENPTEEDYHEWANRRLAIEADEPPIYWALDASCDNEVTIAWGLESSAGLVPLSKWQRLMMNFITFSKTEFKPRKVIEQKPQDHAPKPA